MKKLIPFLIFALMIYSHHKKYVWIEHPFVGRDINETLQKEIADYFEAMNKKGYEVISAPEAGDKFLYRIRKKRFLKNK